ncbi:MAG: PadR family transcriptional regulator [Hyphomonadaceae bacterium]
MRRKRARGATDLEGAALGFLARAGTCTPYAVKAAFAASPTEFWSASAGAIYPLMERLAARGLISVSRDKQDGRARRTIKITQKGRRAFETWLFDSKRALDAGFDPLRTRLLFSDLMSAAQKRAFLTAALEGLETDSGPAPEMAHTLALRSAWRKARRRALTEFAEAQGWRAKTTRRPGKR